MSSLGYHMFFYLCCGLYIVALIDWLIDKGDNDGTS